MHIQKCNISGAWEDHCWHLLAYWGRRESQLNTMWKKLQTEAVFLPKSQSRGSLWRPFSFGGAACGTLGASVWASFCDFGRVLGSSGAKAPKRCENVGKVVADRKHFLGHSSSDDIKSDVVFCFVFFHNYWRLLGNSWEIPLKCSKYQSESMSPFLVQLSFFNKDAYFD